jgi:hypothetical protein
MITGRRNGPENRVAAIHCEHGSCFAAKNIEARDNEAYILRCDRGIQVMGHGTPPYVWGRLASETEDEISANLLGGMRGIIAFSLLIPLA